MNYNCDRCNYETSDLSNFSRHKKSSKHLKNNTSFFIENTKRTLKEQKRTFILGEKTVKIDENEEILSCKYCDKKFTKVTSKYRHQKHYCKYNTEKEIKVLKEQNKELLEVIKNSVMANKNNSEIAKENTQIVSKSMSTLNYAIKHFQDAPTISLLEGKKLEGFIEYNGNTEKSLEEILVHHFEKKKLHQLLGDLIVEEYRKENPKKQSMWSTDVSRLTFILKQTVKNTKNGKWITDKNGLDLTKLIIEPLVEKVIDILKEYINDCGEDIQNINELNYETEIKTRKNLQQMQKANEVVMQIKLKKLGNEILKYIAPYFNLKIDQFECNSDEEE